jgi:homoserine dehydrogenase
MTNIKLGIIGFGCVGQGLYSALQQTKGINAEIVKICVKDRAKKRTLPVELFTFDKEEVLGHPHINTVVELIDDAEAAYEIVKEAILRGKAVVTANKKMLAEHLEELSDLARKKKVPLLYEGSVCGSIPIIRNLEEYYDNDLIGSVHGIFNGSTNYILTKIADEGQSYEEALAQAQALGFAETDPALDVEGYDPKYKLTILLAHTFGLFVKPEEVFNLGINRLSDFDTQYAREKGLKIKLIARSKRIGKKVFALVAPQFISVDDPLARVDREFNAVVVEGAFSERQVFVGKGAGSLPTGSAVLSDISALSYGYQYEYKRHQQHLDTQYSLEATLEVYLRYENPVLVNFDDFDTVIESYVGDEGNFITGRIRFDKLVKATWIHDPTNSLILLEGADFVPYKRKKQEVKEKAAV